MNNLAYEQLRQRADYTHKYNLKNGRHGWLRLTPAYSVRIVEELMNRTQGYLRVFDPFCGTATTALSASYHGHETVTTDINPFLVWLGQSKTARYSATTVAQAYEASEEVLALICSGDITSSAPPPIHNIERWWPSKALDFLCQLQAAIDRVIPFETGEGTLLRVSFCRTVIACSNAAFNHQSMSFRDISQVEMDISDYIRLFRENVAFVLKGAAENPSGEANVFLHDARVLSTLTAEPFDLVVTSPPYANRMSYIRELRPYMYWLGFLVNGRDAGELDWRTIGGTWGVATSRLKNWKPTETRAYTSNELEVTLARIASPNNANGQLLANYIHKYFVDMAKHFAELRAILKPGAKLHYIVGNSTFYGELVSVEKIYAHIMTQFGFTDINIQPIRKRNSKKELFEFDVSARWNG